MVTITEAEEYIRNRQKEEEERKRAHTAKLRKEVEDHIDYMIKNLPEGNQREATFFEDTYCGYKPYDIWKEVLQEYVANGYRVHCVYRKNCPVNSRPYFKKSLFYNLYTSVAKVSITWGEGVVPEYTEEEYEEECIVDPDLEYSHITSTEYTNESEKKSWWKFWK